MKQQPLAKEPDLSSHLHEDWHLAHGLWAQILDFINRKIFTLQSWISVTSFYNSWENLGGGYGFADAGYFKDLFGVVHLRGVVKSGDTNDSSSGAIFYLPTGYRPAYNMTFLSGAGGWSVGFTKVLSVDGEVRAAAGGNNGWWSLDGIIFRAA